MILDPEILTKKIEVLYDKYFKYNCPPSEGKKTKQEGCYNALNEFGKEPNKENCKRCWNLWIVQED